MKFLLCLTQLLVFVYASGYKRPGGLLIERRRFNGSFSCDESKEYDCGIGSNPCIPHKSLCDGKYDCINRLDERDCGSWCGSVATKCESNDRCVFNTEICDGKVDCEDHSDEQNCSDREEQEKFNVRNLTKVSCEYGEFSCGLGERKCIPNSAVCDGVKDCVHGIDERSCRRTCLRGLYPCRDNKHCILKSFFCDGKFDCEDESDEYDCRKQNPQHGETPMTYIRSVLCDQEKEFDCEIGENRCISKVLVCNGIEECSNGVDERNCDYTCPPRYSPCSDGSCISNHLFCDHKQDCSDNSDEQNCPEIYVELTEPEAPSIWFCEQPEDFDCEYGTTRCINEKFVCDGKYDCWNGIDELNCGEPYICHAGMIPCRMGGCRPAYAFCDGQPDCEDNSDESNCPARGRPPKLLKASSSLGAHLGILVVMITFF